MVPRALPPIWLAAPSRYAALSPAAARWLIAVLAGVLLVGLSALGAPAPGDRDPTLHAGIVEGVRSGGDYYTVAADMLRSGGHPLHPFTAVPPPTLAIVQAALPAVVTAALLYALALATMLAWHDRLRPALRGRVLGAGVALLFGLGSLECWRLELVSLPEVWAGLLVALSLARGARPAEAIGWGLAAALIHAGAGPYLVIMAVAAWAEGDRREAAGWGVALLVFALALAGHADAVADIAGPLDPTAPGWAGLGTAIRAIVGASALTLLPTAIAAPLAVLAWWGWFAWRDPLGTRVAVTIAVLVGLLAMTDARDALLVTPVLLIGLVFVPDALRDLHARALDRRRIVVRRVSP